MAEQKDTIAVLDRIESELILKRMFDVDWLLFPYDGKDAQDYPGDYDRIYACPTYGNCPRCYRMGPLGNICMDCLNNMWIVNIPHLRYGIVLARKHSRCERQERWYNPEFLHNTTGDTVQWESIDTVQWEWELTSDAHRTTRIFCRREMSPTRLIPCPPGFDDLGPYTGLRNFRMHMHRIYRHPEQDNADALPGQGDLKPLSTYLP
jgi:hypothetical protein